MDINPRMNGIHSLAEGLRAFKKFHEDIKDIFALKDSILRSHHALETLFKDILYQMNPVFLVSDAVNIKRIMDEYEKVANGKNVTIVDDLWTITLEDSVKRLRRLKSINRLDEREYNIFLDSIQRLTNFRNKLQHFGLSADIDVVARILGNAIPRAIDVLDTISYPSEIMMRAFPRGTIMHDLEKIFPEAPAIMHLPRHDYDRLIKESIQFFKGYSFMDQILKLKIKDYGIVGAGPYMPEIKSEGFLDFEYDRISLVRHRFFTPTYHIGEMELPYHAKLDISQPKFTEYLDIPNNGIAEGSLELEAHIIFDRAEKALNLSNAEEKIAVLRRLTIIIKILLNYKSEAFMTNVHYDCSKIREADGQLSIRLSAIPRGFESEEVELIGQYKASLNEQNASFRLHAFLEPDGYLKDNYHLEWSINTHASLLFNS